MAPNKRHVPKKKPKESHGTNVPSMIFDSRRLHQIITDAYSFDTAATSSESFLGVGSEFVSFGRDYTLRNFISAISSLVQVYDQYRFKSIDVYAVCPNITEQPVMIHSSVDYDDVVDPSWESLAQRSNVSMTVLKIANPVQRVATWTPRANYVSTAGDSPSNLIPRPHEWFDTASITQSFNGIKICASTAAENMELRFYATAVVEFRGRI